MLGKSAQSSRASGSMLLLALATLLFGCSPGQVQHQEPAPAQPQPTIKLTSEYQAVLLTNGQVLIGKLDGLGTPFPVLTDVYYVQNSVDPKTKGTRSVLVKRGKEWHAPDRTIINASHILIVEPVTPGSKVMQLIEQSKTQPPPSNH